MKPNKILDKQKSFIPKIIISVVKSELVSMSKQPAIEGIGLPPLISLIKLVLKSTMGE